MRWLCFRKSANDLFLQSIRLNFVLSRTPADICVGCVLKSLADFLTRFVFPIRATVNKQNCFVTVRMKHINGHRQSQRIQSFWNVRVIQFGSIFVTSILKYLKTKENSQKVDGKKQVFILISLHCMFQVGGSICYLSAAILVYF